MEVIPEYKIILLGEPGVGKTNFFFRLRDGVFVGSTASTVSTGVEHMEYKMRINGSSIKVRESLGILLCQAHKFNSDVLQANLYDTAGGERFRTLTSNYYLNADAAIMMYSVEDSYSFERLKDEADNAKKFINLDEFVWVLVGHKSDLNCEIAEESIAALAAQLETKLSFFASSKTGENVVQLFDKVVSNVHKVRRGRPARCYSQSYGHGLQVHHITTSPNITKSRNDGSSSDCSC